MTCEEARDQLLDAQRARLAPETRAALQTHLQTCAACAHEDAAEALLSEALENRLPQHAAPVALKRRLAAEWPGGLKELDTLDSDEIERRVQACEAGEDAPWMAWMARYHELMRAALALRRGEPATVDAAFVRAVQRPAHGRLNVAVFAQLGREFDVEPRTVWDTLFPRRGKVQRHYR